MIIRRQPARFLAFTVALAFCAEASAAPLTSSPQDTWVGTWAASPEAADPDPHEPLLALDGQTVRQRARVSIGGDRVRLQFSNEHGATPLTIGAATVALPNGPANIKPESVRSLTFGGRSSVTIPPGAPIWSDPVDLRIPAGAELSVSLYFPHRVQTPTLHALALKRAIVSRRGDFTRADHVEAQSTSESLVLLSAVLVPAAPRQRLIVALGDSLTDGDGSTVEADRTWPSDLSRRFNGSTQQVAVINAGIAGNRLLSDGFGIRSLGVSALARFDRDVLSVPGVTHVILLEGGNDLGFAGAMLGGHALAARGETRTTEDLISAYRQLIARAHARGIKVIGATLPPCEGVDLPGYYTPAKNLARQAVNEWIRTSRAFDGVIDFDAVLRDPLHPTRIQARYASPDHLHPNDIGYQAMADAVDLSLFQDRRVFELDVYHAVPGKVAALEARFREASRLQAKHGLNALGYWVPYGHLERGEPAWDNTFIYLIAHSSREDADRNWQAFHADPEFQKYLKAEEAEPLIESVDTAYMRPTDYSLLE